MIDGFSHILMNIGQNYVSIELFSKIVLKTNILFLQNYIQNCINHSILELTFRLLYIFEYI